MSKVIISQQKINELEKEREELKKEIIKQHESERPGILESFKEAAIYDVSVQVRESRITELNTILGTAEVLPESVNSEKVILGSFFEIENEEGKVAKYRLVHPVESEPLEGLISLDSPLGKAVVNKKVNDKVKFQEKEFKVKSVC